jgi:DNA helicase II / ATP-dependent DNA helicase PcrA
VTTSLPTGIVSSTVSDDITFEERLLRGLTPEQREAVTSPAPRLLVRATAGSGKTHVLTLRIQRRIANGTMEADRTLVMTFTRKAADELRQRLWRNGIRDVRAGTFHRAALQLVTAYREDHHLKPLNLETSRRRLITALAAQLRESGDLAVEDWMIPRLEQEVGWALSQGFNGTAYARRAQRTRRQAPFAPAHMADFIDRYVGLCQSRGVLDFDLLLAEATRILREDRTALAAFRYRTRHLFVDETQDMNPLQFTLLKVMAGDDPDLFCVGDPHQSIYGFNGANPALLSDLLHTWPDTTVLDLTRNHRSTEPIVAVASTLLEDGLTGITPAREGGPLPLVRVYDTDALEAEAVASWLISEHSGNTPWRSMAVLARTNAQLEIVAAALTRRDIPFDRRGPDHSPASDLVAGDVGPVTWYDKEQPDAVALSTIHRAKGLEWRSVAVIGLAEGVLPHYSATTPEELEEEQRLAYVALTRAEWSLLLTYSQALDDPRRGRRAMSRFLEPAKAEIDRRIDRDAPASADARRRALAEMRRILDEGSAKA